MTDGGGAVGVIMAESTLGRIDTTRVSKGDSKVHQAHHIDKAWTMDPPGIYTICESHSRLMTNLQSLLIYVTFLNFFF